MPWSSLREILHAPQERILPQLSSQHDARPNEDFRSSKSETGRRLGCCQTDNTLVECGERGKKDLLATEVWSRAINAWVQSQPSSLSLVAVSRSTACHVTFIYPKPLPRNSTVGLVGTRVYNLHSFLYQTANYFFFGFGACVPFELAVVLGVGVAPLGALGAWVFCGLLGCTMCIASVSRNVADLTETDKPVRKTWLSRRG